MELFEYGNPSADAVLIQPVDGHSLQYIENEAALIREFSEKDFRLIAVKVDDWNRDLSPWKAPAVFGKEDFAGWAPETFAEILKLCGDKTKSYYLGGYSLAGLFALWAAYRTELFCGIAAASPSVWFPGFLEMMTAQEIRCGRVYLSLGNKEEKTRNPVMATVGDCIRSAYKRLSEQNVDCVLEWNEGNHFRDSDLRTAKAFAWLLRRYIV